MRLVPTAPALYRSSAALARARSARCDVLDDLKYQLSNADEGTRPARDLVENPVAAAYLLVLAVLGGGLAYLLYLDTQATAKREAAYLEQRQAADMLREQGLEAEAAELDRDLKRLEKASKEANNPPKPKGLQADPYDEDAAGNRFGRRQVHASNASHSHTISPTHDPCKVDLIQL